MMSEPSQANLFENTAEALTPLSAGSRVSRTASPANKRRILTNATCGQNISDSFARLSRESLWVKMSRGYSQVMVDGSLEGFSGTWPRAGMMRNGIVFQQRQLDHHTQEIGYGLLPTPSARDYRDLSSAGKAYAAQRKRHRPSLVTESYLAGFTGPKIPQIYCWAMGFPLEWHVL